MSSAKYGFILDYFTTEFIQMKGVFPMPSQVTILIAVAAVMFFVIGGLSLLAHYYTLSGIKSKTVGDGQHGGERPGVRVGMLHKRA